MPATDPLVSIVVPSWQKGRFLRGALESLLGQTYPHVEIIVRDNCSTDETGGILEAYTPRLTRVVRASDQGQSDALRRGFAEARGDILGWLNADDLLMPDAVERAVAAFQATPEPAVVYGHCALLDEAGQFLRYFNEVQPFSAALLRNRINFIAQPSTFFRRSAYEAIGGVDAGLEYVMDWDLWCRFADAGHRFQFIDAVLSAARHYPETKTSGGGMTRQTEILRLNRRYKTTGLPVAAAAHLYQDLVKAHVPAMHAFFRWLWRLRGSGRYLDPAVVHGLAYPNRLAASPVQIRFPRFAETAGARLALTHAVGAEISSVQATLNGHAGVVQHDGDLTTATWRFDAPVYLAAVDLAITAAPLSADLRLQALMLEGPPVPTSSVSMEE